jgi:hypothetical protein
VNGTVHRVSVPGNEAELELQEANVAGYLLAREVRQMTERRHIGLFEIATLDPNGMSWIRRSLALVLDGKNQKPLVMSS